MRQPQQNSVKPPEQVVNWPLIVCYVAGLPIELLLHNVRTFGARSAGPRGVMAVLLMFLFLAFHPHDNCRPLFWFMIAVIALSTVAQISAWRRQRRGEPSHSRYNGRPHLMSLFPRMSEVTIKRLEPAMSLAASLVIHHFNHPLGSFLIMASMCLGICVGLEHSARRERALDMNDALIDQQNDAAFARSLQRR